MNAFDGGISKLFEVISRISKNDVLIEIAGKELFYEKPEVIKISPSFFYKDGCKCCSRCCGNYGHILTLSEFQEVSQQSEKYKEFLSYLVSESIKVNKNEIIVYRDAPRISGLTVKTARSERPACYWSYIDKNNNYLCKIHEVRSFTCRMPHMMFRYSSATKTTNIGLYDFGRNWALGCPYKLKIGDINSIKANVEKIQYADKVARDLGLETYANEIILKIQDLTSNFTIFRIPEQSIKVIPKQSTLLKRYRRFVNV